MRADRIHNPDNCYHIQLDWLFTSPRLIREAVGRWTALVGPYGLRLVQVPLSEACKYSDRRLFDQPHLVKLSVEPPGRVPVTPHLATHASPRAVDDRQFYHKAILRRLGFVLDYESADSYSTRLDVTFSWGKLDFKMTQFVHKTGLVLAQIAKDQEEWDFLLLPNRLAADRSQPFGREHEGDATEEILNSVQALAGDQKSLRSIYDAAIKPRLPAPSPFTKAVMANADLDVPPIQLPPHLLHRRQSRGDIV